jgi:hypothetical protein
MKFSQLDEILKHKYRDGEDPKVIRRRRKMNFIFYVTAISLVIIALALNVLHSTGVFNSLHIGVPSPEGTVPPWATPVPTPQGEEIKYTVVDRSNGAREMVVDEMRINQPSIYGHEMLFAAGSGSLDRSVLTNLYLFDAVTGEAKKITASKLTDGEIFETYLSEKWIVWVDTDHKGNNVIYKLEREKMKDGKWSEDILVVQEPENHMPRLGLYGDYLVWMEQVSDTEDKLYFVDLTTDENMAITMFQNSAYAVSTPYIFKNMVLWADSDPNRPTENVSAIYTLVFEELGDGEEPDADEEAEDSGELEPEILATGTYVHKPVCNDDVFVWIDKNNAPDSTLYFTYKNGSTPPKALWSNITHYSVGENFICFSHNQIIYAYYYAEDILLQVSEANRNSILPQAFGTLIVWEDKTDSGNDMFKYNIMG